MPLRKLGSDPFAPDPARFLRRLDSDPFMPVAPAINDEIDAAIGAPMPGEDGKAPVPFTTAVADVARSVPEGFVNVAGMGLSGLGSAAGIVNRNVGEAGDKALRAIGMDDIADLVGAEVPWWLDTAQILGRPGQVTKDISSAIGAPEERKNLATDIASGVGQMGGQITAAILSGGLSSVTSTGLLFGMGVDQMEELRQQEAPGKDPTISGDLAVLSGGGVTLLTERYGLDAILNKLPPKMKGAIMQRLASMAAGAGIEAAQEVIENVVQRLTAVATFAPQDNLEDAANFAVGGSADNAIVGGSVGAIARGILDLAVPGRRRSFGDRQGMNEEQFDAIRELREMAERGTWNPEDVRSAVIRSFSPTQPRERIEPTVGPPGSTVAAPPAPTAPLEPGDDESPLDNKDLAEGRAILNAVKAGQPIVDTTPDAPQADLSPVQPPPGELAPETVDTASAGLAPVLRTDGAPFASEGDARIASNSRKDLKGKGYRPVQVQGGYGLSLPEPTAPEPTAAPVDTSEPLPSAPETPASVSPSVSEAGEPISGEVPTATPEPSPPQAANPPRKAGVEARDKWKLIGTNASGKQVFEDENGVRSYTDGGVRVTETVSIIPGGGGGVASAENKDSDYQVVESTDKPQLYSDVSLPNDADVRGRASTKEERAGGKLKFIGYASTQEGGFLSVDATADNMGDARKAAAKKLATEISKREQTRTKSPGDRSQDIATQTQEKIDKSKSLGKVKLSTEAATPREAAATKSLIGRIIRHEESLRTSKNNDGTINIKDAKGNLIGTTTAPPKASDDLMMVAMDALTRDLKNAGHTPPSDVSEMDLDDFTIAWESGVISEAELGGADIGPGGILGTGANGTFKMDIRKLYDLSREPGATTEKAPPPKAEPAPPPSISGPDSAPPKKTLEYGKNNTVFTSEAMEKAKALLLSKKNQLNSVGLDPELMQAGITMAGYHIEAGARSFAAYTKAMIEALGEEFRPYLRSWYEGVRYYPGVDNTGMSTPSVRSAKVRVEKAEQAITDKESSITRMEAAAKMPFAQLADLDKKKQMLVDVEADMAANPAPAPAWLRNGAVVGSDVYVDGEARLVEGHKWTGEGFFVVTEQGAIPYMEAKDKSGFAIYEEHEFTPPVLSDTPTVVIDNPFPEFDGQSRTEDMFGAAPTTERDMVLSEKVDTIISEMEALDWSAEEQTDHAAAQIEGAYNKSDQKNFELWSRVREKLNKDDASLTVERTREEYEFAAPSTPVAFSVGDPLKATVADKDMEEPDRRARLLTWAAVNESLREELNKLGLTDVNLITVEEITSEKDTEPGTVKKIRGFFDDQTQNLAVAYKGATDIQRKQVLGHEALHAFRYLNLISKEEWQVLRQAAHLYAWKSMYRVDQRWVGKTDEQKIEEAIAEAFGEYIIGIRPSIAEFTTRPLSKETKAYKIMRELKARLARFLEAVANWGSKSEYKTAEALFEALKNGTIGDRVRPAETKSYGADPAFSIQRGTTDQQRAINKAIAPRDTRTIGQRIADSYESLKQTLADEFRWMVADEFHGQRKLGKFLNPGVSDREMGAYVAARLSRHSAGQVEAFLRYGAPVWNDQDANLEQDDSGGFFDIVAPIYSKGLERLFDGYAYARRVQTQDLIAEGREKNLTEDDVDNLMELAVQYPEFEEVFDKLQIYKKKVLDAVEGMGLISADQRAIWEKADHVPFYRAVEEGGLNRLNKKKGLAGQSPNIGRLTGKDKTFVVIENRTGDIAARFEKKGEANAERRRLGRADFSVEEAGLPITSVVENIAKNITHLLDAAMKNHAAVMTIDEAIEAGWAEPAPMAQGRALVPMSVMARELEQNGIDVGEGAEGVAAVVAIMNPVQPGNGIVQIRRDGVVEYYRVDDSLVYRSLAALHRAQISVFIKPFAAMKQLLTRTVTAMPGFMARNFARDSGSSWLISSERGLNFYAEMAKSVGALATRLDDPRVKALMAAGGDTGWYQNAPEDMVKQLRAMEKANRIGILQYANPKHMWRMWQRLGRASELANRAVTYSAELGASGSKRKAAFASADLMDFQLKGGSDFVLFFTSIIPFLNARIQGLYKLGRAGAEGGRSRKMFMAKSAMMIAFTMVLAAINAGDDDDEGYNDLPEWLKDGSWVINVRRIFGQKIQEEVGLPRFVLIPKPFELGVLFGTGPERIVQLIAGNDRLQDTWGAIQRAILGTFEINPLGNPVTKEIYEQWSNRDTFTGNPIVSQSLRYLSPEEQYTAGTKETSKAAGRLTGISPARIEHAVRGFTGGLGIYTLAVTDAAARSLGVSPPKATARLDEMEVIRSFMQDGPARSTKWQDRFYQLRGEAETVMRTVNARAEAGDPEGANRLARDNAALLNLRKPLGKTGNDLAGIRNEMKEIRRSMSMSPDQKRQRLDELYRLRNSLAKKAAQATEKAILR